MEAVARLRQMDAVLGPVEQRLAQLLFEYSDARADRGLGAVETLRRPSEVARRGDLEKGP